MNYEEGVIFPHLRDSLTEDDWRHLEHSSGRTGPSDPVSGTDQTSTSGAGQTACIAACSLTGDTPKKRIASPGRCFLRSS